MVIKDTKQPATPTNREIAMRDYDLYTAYALRFGLTFLPKGFSDAAWAAASELMVRALKERGPIVTHTLIDARLGTCFTHEATACSA